MTDLARELESDLAAAHVHAHVLEDHDENLSIVVDAGASQKERDLAIALFFARLHHLSMEHGPWPPRRRPRARTES